MRRVFCRNCGAVIWYSPCDDKCNACAQESEAA